MPNNCAMYACEGANIRNNLIAKIFNIQQKRLDMKKRANLIIERLAEKVNSELATKLKSIPAIYPAALDAYIPTPQCMRININRAVMPVFASPTKAYRTA